MAKTQNGHPPGKHTRTTKTDPGSNHSYGKTSVKVKFSKGKRSIRDVPYPYVDPEYVEDNFAKKYKFRKTPTGRSPVSGWEHAHILKSAHIDSGAHPLEKAMVHGHAHEFKCHEGNKCGRLRLSGSHKAHQVGKRTK